ncbi:MAG: CBS domain-containing protein [Desulfovibrionaceae bacterium]
MLTVADLMTSDVHTLKEDDTLQRARNLMTSQRIRHIPIVAGDGTFLGLLTHRDLLSATISQLAEIDPETQDEIDAGIPIREIMRTDVRYSTPPTPLREAAETLLNHKYGCLPILDDGKLAGILTESDFLKLTISLMDSLDQVDL